MTYMVFGWEGLPHGGMNDFIGAYETLKEAQDAGKDWDWAHVAKSDTLKIVSVNYSGRWTKPLEDN